MKIRGQYVIPPEDRLKNKSIVNEVTGCWDWVGAKKGKTKLSGYGNLIIGSRTDNTRKSISAHRYSYIIFVGEIPEGLFVCHHCDNPSCINPNHLFLGTRQDNVDDREFKKRNKPNPFKRGEMHPQSKLTWAKVGEIRMERKYRGVVSFLAKKYKVNHKTISDILNNKTWVLPTPPKD